MYSQMTVSHLFRVRLMKVYHNYKGFEFEENLMSCRQSHLQDTNMKVTEFRLCTYFVISNF